MGNCGLALHQYELFVRAFLSDEKAIILYINVFGEAKAEMFGLTAFAVFGILGTFYALRSLKGWMKNGEFKL